MKIAIDLGGTFIRAMRFDGNKPASELLRVDCPSHEAAHVVVEAIGDLIESLMTQKVDGIGIAVPSVVDHEKGIVYNATNIPAWKEEHLKEELEQRFGVCVNVDNDVNCFVLGELFEGEGQRYHSFVGITIGTGLGAGIIINGNIYRGINTCAGELGAIPYLDSDFEHYTSSIFLKQRTPLTGMQLTEKALQGDEEACGIFNELGFHLGKLLQVIVCTYDPQAVIIGGGLAKAAQLFEPAMRKSMREDFCYPELMDRLEVVFTNLDNANMKGALHLC